MKITVIGAGPGALSLAACLSLRNYSVSLYEQPDFLHNVSELLSSRTVTVDGYVRGAAKLATVTTKLIEVVTDAEYIFIVTHAAAHAALARALAPLLRRDQWVILFPSYVAGASAFRNELKKAGASQYPCIAETSVLPFACRRTGACSAFIGGWKKDFIVATSEQNAVLTPINDLFGDVPVSESPFEAGLNETNFIIHACVSLFNIGLVESGKDWTFYREGLSFGVGRLIEAVDAERLALLGKLGLQQISLGEWLLRFYRDQGARGGTAYEVLRGFEYFATSKGPLSFSHRYFSEDIPFGLVPMASLGKRYEVPMPVTESLVDIASKVTGCDFRAIGRRV